MAIGDKLNFLTFQRSKLFGPATRGPDGRLHSSLSLKLTNFSQTATGNAPFALFSAADVSGLKPGAILHVAPAPYVNDAETTKLVHIDFAEAELPWRYSPEGNSDQLHPWLVLLVGTSAELEVQGNVVTRVDPAVLLAHPLDKSYLWAHVQDNGESIKDPGKRATSRLFSPRKLEPQREYVAVLVPAFNAQGNPMWNNGVLDEGIVLPAFYSWRFWTAEAGDFETLAAALRIRTADQLGLVPLRYAREVTGVDVTMLARGAITHIHTQSDPTTGVDTARQDFELLNGPIADDGKPERHIIGLPQYGRPWLPNPDAAKWGKTLNEDPRSRGIAGLGVWLGIQAQEQLMDAAVKQAGALRDVSQLVRQLASGLNAAGSLWIRRLPADDNLRLNLFGPAMGRLMTEQGGTLLTQITSGASPLPPAFFSSAGKRLLRDGTARARYAVGASVDRSQALTKINFGPSPIFDDRDTAPHVNTVANGLHQPDLEDVLHIQRRNDRLWDLVRSFDGKPNNEETRQELRAAIQAIIGESCDDFLEGDLSDLGSGMPFFVAEKLMGVIRSHCGTEVGNLGIELVDPTFVVESSPPIPPPRFHRFPLGAVSKIISDTVNPTQARPPVWIRIQARFPKFVIKNLAPPELPLGLDFSTWQLVNQYAKEWMLPGRGSILKDSIVALETNPSFVDAFMVGINTQFMNEMRWRDLAVTRTFTPLRMFWGYVNYEQGNVHREPDIQPFSEWVKQPNTDIGDLSHQTIKPGDTTGKLDLVVGFKTDLFRRYPSTLVYLVKKTGQDGPDTALLSQPPVFEHTAAGRATRQHLGPIFFCDLEPDLRCFMFDLAPTDLKEYWLVLDEPPSELRFRHPQAADPPLAVDAVGIPTAAAIINSAKFAATLIDQPTRVAIDGKWLEEEGES